MLPLLYSLHLRAETCTYAFQMPFPHVLLGQSAKQRHEALESRREQALFFCVASEDSRYSQNGELVLGIIHFPAADGRDSWKGLSSPYFQLANSFCFLVLNTLHLEYSGLASALLAWWDPQEPCISLLPWNMLQSCDLLWPIWCMSLPCRRKYETWGNVSCPIFLWLRNSEAPCTDGTIVMWIHSISLNSSLSVRMHAKSLQLCSALCDSMDCSLPGPSVHGIFQARIRECVARPPPWGSSWARDRTPISCLLHWQVGSLPLAHRMSDLSKK